MVAKDLQAEFRSRFAFNTVMTFVGSALLLILFTLRAQQLPPTPKSGLVWIVILFAALSVLSRSFITETDRQTYDLLRLYGQPTEVYIGKFSYNFLFTFTINIIIFVLYILLLDLSVVEPLALILVLFLGSAGLSSVSTMLGAIVSQADRRGAIFSVLSIPLLFPLILILVRATAAAVFNGLQGDFLNDVMALVGFAGVTLTAGILLFDYIWTE